MEYNPHAFELASLVATIGDQNLKAYPYSTAERSLGLAVALLAVR